MNDVRPLQAIAVNAAAPMPGQDPKLRWLPLARMVIDGRYQRSIEKAGQNNIQSIAQNFKWSRFAPVIVTPLAGKGELYALIDGQHRATAALSIGISDVPAYIVEATPEEAARIFSAVNGQVTRMSAMQVFKAALAGGEAWAIEIRDCCHEARVTPLFNNVPRLKQKPFQTMSVSAMRRIAMRHGPRVLASTLKVLCASKGADTPGFLSERKINAYSSMIAARPGWVDATERLCGLVASSDLELALPEDVERRLVQALGDGRGAGTGWDTICSRVAELRARKLSPQMIAATLRITYAEVERALKEIA